ncbi:MAG: response regulator [Chitinophagales bacterium]|nr:response regulator [Chitinophagales bacterium]
MPAKRYHKARLLKAMDTKDKIVLIVERDTGIANMIRAILGIVNVPVQHVQTGEGATKALKDNSVGLIICENGLPDMDGYDLLKQIRGNATTKQIPFIMLVPESDRSYEKLTQDKAADRYITKPFTARKVLDVVKEFIVYKGL